jgi:hypothetical protein
MTGLLPLRLVRQGQALSGKPAATQFTAKRETANQR